MAKRSKASREPEDVTNGPADIGWTPQAKAGGQRRAAETRTSSTGKQTYQAPTIPDPNIVHEPYKVLQRVDGLLVIFDMRAKPGLGVVEMIDPGKYRATKDRTALAVAKAAAEAIAIRLAVTANQPSEDPHERIHEG